MYSVPRSGVNFHSRVEAKRWRFSDLDAAPDFGVAIFGSDLDSSAAAVTGHRNDGDFAGRLVGRGISLAGEALSLEEDDQVAGAGVDGAGRGAGLHGHLGSAFVRGGLWWIPLT